MKKDVFENKIKPVLTYIGIIGASLTSIAYIILMFVLIKGFKYEQTVKTVVFSVINAAVGLIIANFLKYQGISFEAITRAKRSLILLGDPLSFSKAVYNKGNKERNTNLKNILTSNIL